MTTGADIRRYRKAINLTQGEFAERLSISQSALSLIEGGKTAVSEEHLDRLTRQFRGKRFKPEFNEFVRKLESESSVAQAALSGPNGRHLILTVWKWEEGFDLARAPAPDQAVDLVTVRATENPTIALEMNKATQHWAKGEIFVFERCSRRNIKDGDICLLQIKPRRARRTNTIIASAHLAPVRRGRELQFTPISPSGPIFAADDETVLTMLQATYRARRLL